MSGSDLSALIDQIAADLLPHLGGNEEAADAVAVEIAGEITSRYYLVPIPPGAPAPANRRNAS